MSASRSYKPGGVEFVADHLSHAFPTLIGQRNICLRRIEGRHAGSVSRDMGCPVVCAMI